MNNKYTTVCKTPTPTSVTLKPPPSNPSYTSPPLSAARDERDYTREAPPLAPRYPNGRPAGW